MFKQRTTTQLLSAVAIAAFTLSAQAAGNGKNNASDSSSSSAASNNSNKNTSSGNGNSSGNGSNSSASSGNGSNSSASSGNGSSSSASNGNGSNSSTSNGNGSNSSTSSGNGSNSSASNGSGSSSSASNSNGSNSSASNGSGSSSSASSGNASSSSASAGNVPTPGSTVAWIGSRSDVTYAYDAMENATAANDFYGLVSGNDSKGIDELGLSWGNGWTLVAKDNTDSSDDVRSTWQGITFTVNAGAKSPDGYWSLTGLGGSLATAPLQLDMVAVVKSSTDYALYYFQDLLFDGSAMGSWLSPAFNDKGVQQDLSHLSVYLRMGDPYGLPDGTSPDSGGLSTPSGGGMAMPSGGDFVTEAGGSLGSVIGSGSNAVPEPGSLALVGAALGAMVAIRRKVIGRSA